MSVSVKINITDNARPTITAIVDGLQDRTALHKVLGKRGEVEFRAHFAGREQEPNKTGWPKQHFWSRIRSSTAYLSADKDGATVRISDPAMNQKIHGGRITPKEGKYLTIPAIAAAYGRPARERNNDLVPMIRRGRAVALVERTSGTVWYWLVKSVTQRPDARALPDEDAMEAAMVEEAEDYIERIERRKGQAGG